MREIQKVHVCVKFLGVFFSSIRVTLQSFADNSLEEAPSGGMTVGNTCGSPTDDFMMDMHASNPSPFSHKRTLYSSSTKVLK